jgi:hypothetical protein
VTGFVLQVIEGDKTVRNLPIPQEETSLGTGKGCDISVRHGELEELHCRFLCQKNSVMFKDESLERDSRINGKKAKRGEGILKPGDKLKLGSFTLLLVTQDEIKAQAQEEKKRKLAAKAARIAKKQKEANRAAQAQQEDEQLHTVTEDKLTPPNLDQHDGDSEDDLDYESEDELAPESADELDTESQEELEPTVRRRSYKRQNQWQDWAQKAVPILVVLFVAWLFFKKMKNNAIVEDDAVAEYNDNESSSSGSRSSSSSTERGPGSVVQSGGSRSQKADQAWLRLAKLDPDTLADQLQSFSKRFPADPRAADARLYSVKLKTADGRSRARLLTQLLAEAKKIEFAGDWGRSYALLSLASNLGRSSKPGTKAREEQKRLKAMASETLADLSARAQLMSQNMGPVQALILVLESRDLYRGLDLDSELEALIKGLEDQIADSNERRDNDNVYSAEASTLEHDAIQSALRLDFKPAREKLDQILELNLREKERFKIHWLRQQVLALQDLVKEMIKNGKKSYDLRPEITLPGKITARLKGADDTHLILSAEKGRGELRWPWRRLTAFQIQQLFQKVSPADIRLCEAKAFHAFKTGLEQTGFEILIHFAKKKRYRSEVFSFYALVTANELPRGGYTIFERRFVDPEEKSRLLAAREAAKEAVKAVVTASAEEKQKGRLLALMKKVKGLMDEGYYQSGKKAYAKLAELHPDVEGVGDVARERLESPMLRRRDIKLSRKKGQNGPSANRLDFYFMGDGFVLSDQKQRSFDRNADSAQGIVSLQDFFKEYDNFINYWAVNLESNDEGVERDGKTKDTALGTAIIDGRYMVRDRARIFSILDRCFPYEHDRQAIVIGNDHANIATGGGGTAAVCKTMLQATPHEIGHAYGGLGDEYNKEPGPKAGPPAPYTGPFKIIAPNVIAGNNRIEMLEKTPWKGWLDPTGESNWTKRPIDLVEGANRQPRGYWRPQQACCMKDSGSPFCAICMEVMVRRLYTFVKPIDRVWPDEKEVTAEKKAVTFRVLALKPKTHDVFVHWRLKKLGADVADIDGKSRERPEEAKAKNISGRLQVLDGYYVHYIKLRAEDLEAGRYEVSAQVWDPTPWVREEFRKELTAWQRWTLEVPEALAKPAKKK